VYLQYTIIFFFFFGEEHDCNIFVEKQRHLLNVQFSNNTIKFYVFLSMSDKSNNFKSKYQLNFIFFSNQYKIIKNQLLFN